MQITEWPARRCAGPCNQGRSECKTPDACLLPDRGDGITAAGYFWLGYAAFIVAALLAVWVLAGGL